MPGVAIGTGTSTDKHKLARPPREVAERMGLMAANCGGWGCGRLFDVECELCGALICWEYAVGESLHRLRER